jgi:hypothetical protein
MSNVTTITPTTKRAPKDKTGAERQRRFKAKRKAQQQLAATVTMPVSAPVVASVEILPAPQPRRYWTSVGRSTVGLAIIGTGAWIAVTSMAANGWFGASISPDPVAGRIYANLSVAAEVMACLIPTGIRFYRNGGERWTAFRGWTLLLICLAVVFLASGGFAISNLNAGIEARAERETSALRDLRAQIASLDKSITGECVKRGDRCRDLERQRADAQAKLSIERDGLKTGADPQAQALGISSANLHLVQAGAMVMLCLFSGLFISFGAGLVWPR